MDQELDQELDNNSVSRFSLIKFLEAASKQAENGLQSRSSKNGSVALWIKIAVIRNWR